VVGVYPALHMDLQFPVKKNEKDEKMIKLNNYEKWR
jgi:hypothetical protein